MEMTQELQDQLFQQARQAGRDAGKEEARAAIGEWRAEVSSQLVKQGAELHFLVDAIKEIKDTFAASAQVRYTAIEDITALKGRVTATETAIADVREDIHLLKVVEVEIHDLKPIVTQLQGGNTFTRDRLWNLLQSVLLAILAWYIGHSWK